MVRTSRMRVGSLWRNFKHHIYETAGSERVLAQIWIQGLERNLILWVWNIFGVEVKTSNFADFVVQEFIAGSWLRNDLLKIINAPVFCILCIE